MQLVKRLLQKTEGFIYPYLKQKEQGRDGIMAWADGLWLTDERQVVIQCLFCFCVLHKGNDLQVGKGRKA